MDQLGTLKLKHKVMHVLVLTVNKITWLIVWTRTTAPQSYSQEDHSTQSKVTGLCLCVRQLFSDWLQVWIRSAQQFGLGTWQMIPKWTMFHQPLSFSICSDMINCSSQFPFVYILCRCFCLPTLVHSCFQNYCTLLNPCTSVVQYYTNEQSFRFSKLTHSFKENLNGLTHLHTHLLTPILYWLQY